MRSTSPRGAHSDMANGPSRPHCRRPRHQADPMCWDFWGALDRSSPTPTRGPSCAQCPVFRSRAEVCHEIRPLLPGGTVRAPSCPDCLFLATVRGIESDEG